MSLSLREKLQAVDFVWEILMTLVACMLIPAAIGLWIDRQLHLSPIFLLAGLLLGLFFGCYLMVRKTRASHPPTP